MNIVFLGRDGRFEECRRKLGGMGVESCELSEAAGEEEVRAGLRLATHVFCPVPLSRDGRFVTGATGSFLTLDFLVSALKENGARLVGGITDDAFKARLSSEKIPYTDICSERFFIENNSILTAEGVLASLISDTDCAVYGHGFLVAGFGNCGSRICRLLKNLGGKVFVVEKNPARQKEACESGYNICDNFSALPKNLSAVINTVPERIFSRTVISEINPSCAFFELACPPGGFEKDAAKIIPERFFPLPSLPAKYSKKTAADVLLKTFLLSENIEIGDLDEK